MRGEVEEGGGRVKGGDSLGGRRRWDTHDDADVDGRPSTSLPPTVEYRDGAIPRVCSWHMIHFHNKDDTGC